jgi:hypothetical protein
MNKGVFMNKKRIFILLVLAVIVVGGVFAEGGVKNYASGEASLYGGGARYEWMLTDQWSIGGTAFWHGFFFEDSVGVLAAARFYPTAGMFYIELGLGFGIHTYAWIVDYLFGTQPIYGVMLNPGIGWRIDFGDPGGFFINPMISLPVVLGGNSRGFGWGVNVRAGIGFGYAF